MTRPVPGPFVPRKPTAAERSAKLRAPGEAAGDAEDIADQQAVSERVATRRRAKLIREVEESPSGDGAALHDELGDDSIAKAVDDLVK